MVWKAGNCMARVANYITLHRFSALGANRPHGMMCRWFFVTEKPTNFLHTSMHHAWAYLGICVVVGFRGCVGRQEGARGAPAAGGTSSRLLAETEHGRSSGRGTKQLRLAARPLAMECQRAVGLQPAWAAGDSMY